jgi:hypothetical protein
VDTVVDGIKAVTDNLPDSGALTSWSQAMQQLESDSEGRKIVTHLRNLRYEEIKKAEANGR